MTPSKPKGTPPSFETGLVKGWAFAVESLRAYARLGVALGQRYEAEALYRISDLIEKDGPPTPAHLAGEKKEAS